jgi:acyl dehydratase
MIKQKNIRVGMELTPLTRAAYQRALDEFPFLPDSSHKDDYARTKGYASALLSGYILCGYISKYMVEFFGPGWLQGGKIELAFVKAVHQREQITIKATVIEKTEQKDGTLVKLDFWIEKGEGIKVVVGNATGVIKF